MQKPDLPPSLRRWHTIIDDVSDEREDGDGYWVYLAPGFINTMTETHMVHEDTFREIVEQLRDFVEPCACDDCKAYLH